MSTAFVLMDGQHAGMQRVRTQVMVLKYAMVLADYRTQDSAADLAHEAQAFEATIRGLRDGSEELGLSPATSEDVRTPDGGGACARCGGRSHASKRKKCTRLNWC